MLNWVWFDVFKKTAPRFGGPDVGEQQTVTTVQGLGSTQLVQHYAQLQWQPALRWKLNAGYHLLYLFVNNSSSAELRVSAQYQLAHNQRLSLAYGLHGNTLSLMACYVTDTAGRKINTDLKILKIPHFVLAWNMFAKRNIRPSAEAYAQRRLHVPVQENPACVSGSISIDIQNALNQPYATRTAYDPVNNRIYLEYRGELVPLLAFQADF